MTNIDVAVDRNCGPRTRFAGGMVTTAHSLVLTFYRTLDGRRQRGLSRFVLLPVLEVSPSACISGRIGIPWLDFNLGPV
jgi:hypothetical protein